jgi:putative ABC transport system permease protein
VVVQGCGADLPEIWRFPVAQGRFFPAGDDTRGGPLIVLGAELQRDLFGESNALGRYVDLAGQRFLVVGVMTRKGTFLGLDLDETAYIPVAAAQRLFGRRDVARIDVAFSQNVQADQLKERIRQTLMASRGGSDDFTIATQGEMLDTLDRVIAVLTATLAGIAAISLVVGATGIVTVMWISVSERRAEIGLSRALGSTPGQVLALILTEAILLSSAGGAAGVALAWACSTLISVMVPALPFETPPSLVFMAVTASGLIGLVSGVVPAYRAAHTDPVDALRVQ